MLAALCAIAAAPSLAAATPVLDFSDETYAGIRYERWIDAAIPARIHLTRVNLSSSEISVYATAEVDKAIPPSEYAGRVLAQVAINGDFFAAAGFVPRGLAVGDYTPWSQTADDATSGLIRVGRVGERTVAVIVPPEIVVDPAALPPETQGVVAGRPMLVRAGLAVPPACMDPETLACIRAPRTAVALSADGNVMWLVVVDGWQPSSAGLSGTELAGFLIAHASGVHDALGLDVGGSSAMFYDGAVASAPSDGVERPVANHIAVRHGALPDGQLVGVICDGDIFDCDPMTDRIEDATVTLDDGRVFMSLANGFYDFPMVTPRYACVDVFKDGYYPARKCAQVESGMQTYNSVGLIREGTIVDAGPQPDGGPPGADGPGVESPDTCCGASGGSSSALLAIVFAGLVLRRRAATAVTARSRSCRP
jgi:hypothetical protein